MAISEFALIAKYFDKPSCQPHTTLAVGDDAAIIQLPPGQQLVTSVDTLVSGTHFFPDAPAHAIGYKALASSLSDLAAMAAQPHWFTLSLTLPEADEDWLSGFSAGLFDCAKRYGVDCIGGDTSRGPLNITIQVGGSGQGPALLTRAGAQLGDKICVTGTLGGHQAALEAVYADHHNLMHPEIIHKLYYPEPQLELALTLRGVATAAIDISDGLAADLGHLLKNSQKGAILESNKIPLSDNTTQLETGLYGGEDYQLCFTVPESKLNQVDLSAVTVIGTITDGSGCLLETAGSLTEIAANGWQHFK